jgi:hypothetical protein
MTAEERKLSHDLVVAPPHGIRRISKEEFLRRFPSSVKQGKLALRLLEEAENGQNAEDLLCALTVGYTFGFAPKHTDVLCRLVGANWHFSHEDVVGALDDLRVPDAVRALYHATQWVPEYLNFDETRALAVKAIWALGKIAGGDAEEKLEGLTRSDDPTLRENAADQLRRRHTAT